jgi:hypothetical protein
MIKLKWTDKLKNEEVHKRIDDERTLWDNIEKKRTRWNGHTFRHNGFVMNEIEGKIEGKGPREKPRGYINETNKEVSAS